MKTRRPNEFVTEPVRSVPVYAETDVVVIGGGPAGVAAALAAARGGARVILVEQYGYLGGKPATCHNPILNWVDPKVQGGIATEIFESLRAANQIMPESYIQKNSLDSCVVQEKYDCYMIDEEYLKYLFDQKTQEAGVEILFNSRCTGVSKEGEKITGVFIETLEGRLAILTETLIDASGYAFVAWQAGAPVVGENFEIPTDDFLGERIPTQSGYNTGVWFRNMDYEKYREYAQTHPEWEKWHCGRESYVKWKEDGRLKERFAYFSKAEWPDGRAWSMCAHYPIPKGRQPWEADVASDAELVIRESTWNLVNLLHEIPGMENITVEQTAVAAVCGTGQHRLDGEYCLVSRDLFNREGFEDSIFVSNTVPDIYHVDGRSHYCVDIGILPYEVPYRILLARNFDNLLCPGSSASTDMTVWSCTAHVVQCMQAGQAAGTAAALAKKKGTTPKHLDVKALQEQLRKDGVVVKASEIPPERMAVYRERAETMRGQES